MLGSHDAEMALVEDRDGRDTELLSKCDQIGVGVAQVLVGVALGQLGRSVSNRFAKGDNHLAVAD